MARRTFESNADPLRPYFAEIHRSRILTPEEELELARRVRDTGDASAAHRLVTANLRFVVKVAYRYRWSGVKISDLIQEGNIGLMRAVRTFDPERGLRFVSYAVWSIRAAIQEYILQAHSLVKFGTTRSQRRLFFALGRTTREFERRDEGRAPANAADRLADIAQRLGVTAGEVEEIGGRIAARDVSLDAPIGDDGDGSRLDLLEGHAARQDHQLATEEIRALVEAKIHQALAGLDARERYILEQRVMCEEPMTLSEVGAHLGLGRERTRQLEARAKVRLRRELRAFAAEIEWPCEEAAPEHRGDVAA
jgi:RNA polymerase sigma-32 factor